MNKLTHIPFLQSHSEVQSPGAGEQILSSVFQFRVVVPDTFSRVALCDQLQTRVPFLHRTNERREQVLLRNTGKVVSFHLWCESKAEISNCENRHSELQTGRRVYSHAFETNLMAVVIGLLDHCQFNQL